MKLGCQRDGRRNDGFGSGGPLVLVDDAAEDVVAPQRSAARGVRGHAGDGGCQLQSAVGPCSVVVRDELSDRGSAARRHANRRKVPLTWSLGRELSRARVTTRQGASALADVLRCRVKS